MDVAILDLGSHTIKAGVPYNFPADGEPSVVILSYLYLFARYCAWKRS